MEATRDFAFMARTYFPLTYSLPFSPDHYEAANDLEYAIRYGGLKAFAMPRGTGKTALCETACIRSILLGLHLYIFLIANAEPAALKLLHNIKTELFTNDLLLEDWPEVCYPIRCLERQSRRAVGQLYRGNPTYIEWSAESISLPMIPGSLASGATIQVAGLTGNIRGATRTLPDGRRIRPSLVIADDPQTDQSARSPAQCAQRMAILKGAVLGLAGPGKRPSVIVPCTIVEKDDMADQLLDRKQNPDWQGRITKLVYAWPTHERLWDENARIRAESLMTGGDGSDATEFYRQHRAEMDAGARVAWESRYDPASELSALQHAYNLRLRDPVTFAAEYQNEPVPKANTTPQLTADQVIAKATNRKRGEIPSDASRLTAYIDVQGQLLYYAVSAWADDFEGYAIDYGTWPDQHRPYFTLADARRPIGSVVKRATLEGQIYAALEALVGRLATTDYRREAGAVLRLERLMIDANWGEMTDLVYRFCRHSTHAGLLLPSHGQGIRPSKRPHAWRRKAKGDRVGIGWKIPALAKDAKGRHILCDTNYWKTFFARRLATPMGERGCFSLFAGDHRCLADHFTAEDRSHVIEDGIEGDEWHAKPGRDNHWWDCFVGSAIAASERGVTLAELKAPPKPQRRRRKVSYLS